MKGNPIPAATHEPMCTQRTKELVQYDNLFILESATGQFSSKHPQARTNLAVFHSHLDSFDRK